MIFWPGAGLSAGGRLCICWFAIDGLALRAPLRAGASDQALAALIADRWQQRDDRWSQLRQAATEPMTTVTSSKKIEMSYSAVKN